MKPEKSCYFHDFLPREKLFFFSSIFWLREKSLLKVQKISTCVYWKTTRKGLQTYKIMTIIHWFRWQFCFFWNCSQLKQARALMDLLAYFDPEKSVYVSPSSQLLIKLDCYKSFCYLVTSISFIPRWTSLRNISIHTHEIS